MNVVLLSDFSNASTHMLEYASLLLKNHDVKFTILHVKAPCKGESCKGGCGAIFNQKLQKDSKVLVSKGFSNAQVETQFIEGSFVESIRQVILEQKIDLIMLGNSNNKILNTGLFFDKKTLEIITKIKCSVVLVPENAPLKLPESALLPTDLSIISDYSIFDILTSLKFVQKTHLSLLATGQKHILKPYKAYSKKIISKVINSISFKSVQEIDLQSKNSQQSKFDFIMVMAKNLSIFQMLFSNANEGYYNPNTPVLFLHSLMKK